MLVTRPEPEASDTAQRLAALDIEAVIAPLLRARVLATSLPDPRGFSAIAVTSAAALRALAERDAIAPYRGLPLFAVGEKTARTAQAMGFSSVEMAGGTLGHLVEKLAHAGLGGPVFYPAARDLSGDLARSLAPYGVMVITTRVYAMDAADALPEPVAADLGGGAIDAALFYSRRTAETFVRLATPIIGSVERRRVGVLCLSEAIAEPLIDAHFVRVGLADSPGEQAMMRLALSFSRDGGLS
ncbi:MAG: uroporphyrinogen-III synthase [Devosia sp.]